jgi:hypothetical protein
MFNVEEIKESITVYNGKSMMATKVGGLKFLIFQINGCGLYITHYEINFVPKLGVSLFIINKNLKNGCHLSDKCLLIYLSKGTLLIPFEIMMKTTIVYFSGIKLLVNEYPDFYNTPSCLFMESKLILMRQYIRTFWFK